MPPFCFYFIYVCVATKRRLYSYCFIYFGGGTRHVRSLGGVFSCVLHQQHFHPTDYSWTIPSAFMILSENITQMVRFGKLTAVTLCAMMIRECPPAGSPLRSATSIVSWNSTMCNVIFRKMVLMVVWLRGWSHVILAIIFVHWSVNCRTDWNFICGPYDNWSEKAYS